MRFREACAKLRDQSPPSEWKEAHSRRLAMTAFVRTLLEAPRGIHPHYGAVQCPFLSDGAHRERTIPIFFTSPVVDFLAERTDVALSVLTGYAFDGLRTNVELVSSHENAPDEHRFGRTL
ncbi:hypothetical protein MRX96_009898 [Rhipicephalus microplus]